LNSNTITNTSRNPRFVDVFAENNIISNNYMQGLMSVWDYRSGCGIWVKGLDRQKVSRCNIIGNIVSFARDIGIALIDTEKNLIRDNQLIKFSEVEDYIPVYAENSNDKISDNIADGTISLNSGQGRDKFLRNYDEAVQSLYE
jgi:parallel beta-helix repeat protein